MANYHNAVSDKLVVSFFYSHAVYTVFSKENELKWTCIQTISQALPAEMDGSIFSTTHCVNALSSFILIPIAEEKVEECLKLNFASDLPCNKDLSEDVKIVYEVPNAINALAKTLVNASIESDALLALNYFRKKKFPNALYFYEADNVLTLIVIKNGNLLLANRYITQTLDELFYYVMLAVEQLDLPTDELHTECISTKGRHEDYQALFKNYLPNLSLTPVHWELNIGESSDNKDIQLLAAFFSQCVL